jgi:hypothetical protein
MSTTVILTGEVPNILIMSGCLGLLLSFLLLRLYRRAMKRGMARRTEVPVVTEAADIVRVTPVPPSAPLAITYADLGGERSAVGGGDLYRRARIGPLQAAAVYGLGGVFFAAALAFAVLLSDGLGLRPLRFLLLFWVYAWPLVPALWLVATATRREKRLVTTAYVVGYGVLTFAVVITSPNMSASQAIFLWIIINLPPTLIFLVFLLRQVRAVGPLVVTLLFFSILRHHRCQPFFGGGQLERESALHPVRPLLVSRLRRARHLCGVGCARLGLLHYYRLVRAAVGASRLSSEMGQ